ncbi:MAG: hypothetical protein R2756_06030 [Bacteroidales bacterium]
MMDPGGYGDCAASTDVVNLYEAGDVRADLFLQPAEWPGEYWSLKYPGRLGRTPHREFNFPVLRLAEMYLYPCRGYSSTGLLQALRHLKITMPSALTAVLPRRLCKP